MAYETRRFNAAFTRNLKQFQSWANSTQFLVLPHNSLRIILLLFSHVCLGLLKGHIPASLSFKILKILLPSSIYHLNLLDLITVTILGEWCKLRSSSFWSRPILHSPFSSPFCPHICVRILFLKIFKFLERSKEQKSVWTE